MIFDPALCVDFFNQDGITRRDEMISVLHFWARNWESLLDSFSILLKIVDKLLFQIQYLISTNGLLLVF